MFHLTMKLVLVNINLIGTVLVWILNLTKARKVFYCSSHFKDSFFNQ